MKKIIKDLSKGKAFTMCFWAILIIYSTMFFAGILKDNLALVPVSECLTALCSITAGFIGFQVANNGVKGKFFNAELYEKENNHTEV